MVRSVINIFELITSLCGGEQRTVCRGLEKKLCAQKYYKIQT